MNKRSLTTIMLMGIIATVLVAFAGSVFVSKVGGAENVKGLEKDLREVFGRQMEDPEALSVKIRSWQESTGLEVTYRPAVRLSLDEPSLRRHMDRVAIHILAREEWKTQAGFVLLRLELDKRRPLEKRYLPTDRRQPE